MSEEKLICVSNGRQVGELIYLTRNNSVSFKYNHDWLNGEASHPVSLGLPMSHLSYSGEKVTNFLWGLLPDDPKTLQRWGKEHQVSANNAFRLLWHRGEDCAGNVQFIQPDQVSKFKKTVTRASYDKLTLDELNEMLEDLVEAARSNAPAGHADEGKFSLAGVQPKVALYYDEEKKVWGRPLNNTPTSHILKPQANDYVNFAVNEHFCVTLARKVGMAVTQSSILENSTIPTIVIKRYDRAQVGGALTRIHQEDFCQALGIHPDFKYENDGGPTALEAFRLIERTSSRPDEDMRRFFQALVFNWIISGTDAHAKNYSLLIGAENEVRMAPLYDLASHLYYQDRIHLKKQKLAMKIGGEYRTWRIGRRQWEKLIAEIPREAEVSLRSINLLINDVENQVTATVNELTAQGLKKTVVRKLGTVVRARCRDLKTSSSCNVV